MFQLQYDVSSGLTSVVTHYSPRPIIREAIACNDVGQLVECQAALAFFQQTGDLAFTRWSNTGGYSSDHLKHFTRFIGLLEMYTKQYPKFLDNLLLSYIQCYPRQVEEFLNIAMRARGVANITYLYEFVQAMRTSILYVPASARPALVVLSKSHDNRSVFDEKLLNILLTNKVITTRQRPYFAQYLNRFTRVKLDKTLSRLDNLTGAIDYNFNLYYGEW